MDLKTISATLALLGSSLPCLSGCDGPKEVPGAAPNQNPAGDEKAPSSDKKEAASDAKAEMKCAPGACGEAMADEPDAEDSKEGAL